MILATILSNGNAETIGDAVRSALLLADRVLLVDTGIKDRTVEVARDAGGERVAVETWAWTGSFADARNWCLRRAGEFGAEWCLHIDSDETLHLDRPAPDIVSVIESEHQTRVWQISSGDGSYVRERLIRCGSDVRWVGRTHESIENGGVVRVLPGVRVSGRPKSAEDFAAKLRRDLSALQLETAEHPDNPRWWYYLGQTLEDLGRLDEAILAYERCYGMPGWSEQAAWAAFRAAVCLTRLRKYEEAWRVCTVGLQRDGRFPELAWLAGWSQYQIGDYETASVCAKHALLIADTGAVNQRIGFRYTPGWQERPADLLRWCQKKFPGEMGLSGRPNIVVLGVGHSNTTITARQLHAMGWNAGDADAEYAESVSVREINHRLLGRDAVSDREMDRAIDALPQPWALKDPRFAYGTLHVWEMSFRRYKPLLLWVTKDRYQVLSSFERRGENAAGLDNWLAYCAEQFAAWPWAKLKLDAAEIGAACELWKGKTAWRA